MIDPGAVIQESTLNTATVWWRVSTDEQRETSPDTQISEAVALARSEGYDVPKEHILGTDWHSMSVWDSPPMEKLKDLIRAKVIGAVFMYEADRGPSKAGPSAPVQGALRSIRGAHLLLPRSGARG